MDNAKLALVTGASSGLGKALCIALAAKGVPLLLTGRNLEALRSLATSLSVPTEVIAADLSKREERASLASLIREKKPDLIINNAGFGLYGPVLNHPLPAWQEMTAVNSDAVMELTIAAVSTWKEAQLRGTVLNIASAAAYFSYPTFAVYAATKAFVLRFSQALDAELSVSGIRVLTACPGQIETPFRVRASGGFFNKKGGLSVEKAAALMLHQIQTGKSVAIIDWRYRLGVAFFHLLPQKVRAAILQRGLSKRYPMV